jgi:hypothetical protein
VTTPTLPSPFALQQKKEKKATVALLPLPFSLRCNKTKRRRWQQSCRHLLHSPTNKQKEEGQRFRHLLCYVATKQKEEGNNNVAVIAFIATLQTHKKKKATLLSFCFTVAQQRRRWQRCYHCLLLFVLL